MKELEAIKKRTEGHTEGPLVVDDEEQTVRVGYAGEIMFDRSAESRSYWNECRPNAELIAAAPKLLAALEAVGKLASSAPRMVTFTGATVSGNVVADDILKAISEALA